jgi:hypothetical protein
MSVNHSRSVQVRKFPQGTTLQTLSSCSHLYEPVFTQATADFSGSLTLFFFTLHCKWIKIIFLVFRSQTAKYHTACRLTYLVKGEMSYFLYSRIIWIASCFSDFSSYRRENTVSITRKIHINMKRQTCMWSRYLLFCQILNKIWIHWQILVKIPTMKLHDNPSRGSHTVRCRQTEGRADMSLIVIFAAVWRTGLKNHCGPDRTFISRRRRWGRWGGGEKC